ncbi:NLI interacting factor-like phosphatase (macronuclear) [Tetrahymena thermophila SB210]|uniref:NLI interacting factor-like phosphatase n=1 Tax=Tetrahymena thermophila (strain SB210) TaxID=312017 RepID=I7LXM8_TETTS|nr:NLI interacting factor-like phosphatase [Tetrahymena thermophila SB210]EAS04951.1 NLI interacting factor-like phosphatase [Tetrahymena thermophila SB210]|eukprot:XP_001025196.1 NLI interacting factor-like phosphatase [Tetrahymena thermophila SB210]
MDKLFHFQAGSNNIKIKGQPGLQYYSDAEVEQKPYANKEVIVKKENPEGGVFKLDFGYATDENSDNENFSLKATSKMNNGKLSKFKNLSTQKHDGDNDLNQDEDLNNELSTQLTEPSKLKIKKSNSILENARKEVASVLQKNHLVKQHDLKSHIQMQERLIDSDAEAKNVAAKNEIIDSLKNHRYRHLIFSNYIAESSFKKHLTLVYRGLVYSTRCLKGPSEKYIESKKVNMKRPQYSKGKTLLLDLDETLIHTCSLKENPDQILKFKNEIGETQNIGLRIRPFCYEFLQKMTQFWDIFIFTASSSTYAEAIINFIDPTRKYISGILNRSNCMETKNGFFIKDLRIVSGSDLRYTILVDNLSHSFGFQIDNGVPILEWHNDKKDTELKYLMNYLIQAAQSNDVREFNRKNLKLSELVCLQPEELGI